MYKIFTKSIFSLFLIVILLLNLIFFFDFTQLFSMSGTFVSYQDKYFGFDTLYRFFSQGFVEDSSFLLQFRNLIDNFVDYMKKAAYENWVTFSKNGGVYDLISFFMMIVNFLNSLILPLIFLSYLLTYAIYVLSVFVWIVMKFFAFLTGNYFSYVPLNPYTTIPIF